MSDRPERLTLTRFGNPILRRRSKKLTAAEIRSQEIQQLIRNIRHTTKVGKYGVGLAAPQVGKSIALSVITIRPTPNRPDGTRFEQVIINPKYEGIGNLTTKWEGCMSCGTGDDILYAKASRFNKINAEWTDEFGKFHQEELSGFLAHVFQHETDHLNGILFVDRVKDTSTYMMGDEYHKRIVKTRASKVK